MASFRFRTVVRTLAILSLFAAGSTLSAQELVGERAQKANAIKADLQKLSELERSYFAQNKTFTVDLTKLGFAPQSGALVTMSYASARAWAANATHTGIEPYVCFAIVSSPTASVDVDKPFCTDSRRGSAATSIAKAGASEGAKAPSAKAVPAPQKAVVAAPAKADAPKPAPTPAAKEEAQKAMVAAAASKASATAAPKATVAAAPKAAAPKAAAPKAAEAAAPKAAEAAAPKAAEAAAPKAAEAAAPKAVDAEVPKVVDVVVAQAPAPRTKMAPPNSRRSEPSVRGKKMSAPTMPAQGDVAAEARAQTRAASAVRGSAAPEAVSSGAFTERLTAIAAGAREALAAKAPEVSRDSYESSGEYATRRAQALAVYERREEEFFAKNSRTFVVQITGKDARYDPDREVLDIGLETVALPVARDLGSAQLAVACYTRPVFWCSPDGGMTYEAMGLWRVARAKARELDVLRAPITVQARFVVGHRDDQHGAAVTLIGLELVARGQVLAKWDVTSETR